MAKTARLTNPIPIVGLEDLLLQLSNLDPVLAQDYYDATVDRRSAFTVSYLTAQQDVAEVLRQLTEAVKEGQTFEQWRQEVLSSGLVLRRAHLATVWRTNIFEALNDGRYDRFDKDREFFPWAIFEAVDDDKTRDNHAANDGLCMLLVDPRWEGRCPSLGYNCRCLLINLTEAEAKARGLFFDPKPDSLADSADWGGKKFGARVFALAVLGGSGASLPPGSAEFRDAVDEWLRAAETRFLDDQHQRFEQNFEARYGTSLKQSVRDTLEKNQKLGRITETTRAKYLAQPVEYLGPVHAYTRWLSTGFVPGLDAFVVTGQPLDATALAQLVRLRESVRALPPSQPLGYKQLGDKVPTYTRDVVASRQLETQVKWKVGDVLDLTGPQSFCHFKTSLPWARTKTEVALVSWAGVNLVDAQPLSTSGYDGEMLGWDLRLEVVAAQQLGDKTRYYVRGIDGKPTKSVAAERAKRPFGTYVAPGGLTLNQYLDAAQRSRV